MNDTTIALQAPAIMKLNPEWFQNGYYVYAVTIKYNDETYYYIGMTGDRKHLVARSPFYRMSGHFIIGKSTQNQIIKGIERTFNVSIKDADDILCKMDFTYYSWLIKPYKKGTNEKLHHANRTIAEKIESGLILKCKENFGKQRVFNHHVSRKDFAGFETEVEQIFEQLKSIENE